MPLVLDVSIGRIIFLFFFSFTRSASVHGSKLFVKRPLKIFASIVSKKKVHIGICIGIHRRVLIVWSALSAAGDTVATIAVFAFLDVNLMVIREVTVSR